MKYNREIKTGMLVVVAFIILLWGINYLKGHDLLVKGTRYYGEYNRVDGLSDASPIFYKGFKIGAVRDIEIVENDHVRFIVAFDISKNVRFPDNTLAQIYSLDLMGTKGVQFIEGDSKVYLNPGDTLKSSVMGDFVDQMSMQVLPLKEKTEKLIVKLDSSLAKMSGFFSEENQQLFTSTLTNINTTMANFAEISTSIKEQMNEGGSLNNSIHKFESFATALENQKEGINKTITNFSELSEKLKNAEIDQTIVNLNNTLAQADSLLAEINNGNGTAGMLIHDKELYYRLTDASANMDRLLTDVRNNPKRYLNFSAINVGKRVYVQDNGLEGTGIVFMVLINESKTPIEGLVGTEIEPGQRIYEDFDGSSYLYTTAQTSSYQTAEQYLVKVKSIYPDAKIIAYEYGSSIRLQKAIKKSQK